MFISNKEKLANKQHNFFKNVLGSMLLATTLATNSFALGGIISSPIEFKPYFMDNGEIKLKAFYESNEMSFDPKVSIPTLLEKKNAHYINANIALIEQILKDVKKFEKEYDISKIDYPNVKDLKGQLNVIFNCNLKDLVKSDQLTFSELYLKYESNKIQKEFDTPDGKMNINDIMNIAEEEVLNLINEYNSKVININTSAADVTYGYTPENVGTESFGDYKPNKEKVKEIEKLIVKNDFDKTLINLFNNSEKLQLFTPGELNQIEDYVELKKSLNILKSSNKVDSYSIDLLEKNLNTLSNSLNKKFSDEFKDIYSIDLTKETEPNTTFHSLYN